jgi:tetratricopeptide (TPR) repeat protein
MSAVYILVAFILGGISLPLLVGFILGALKGMGGSHVVTQAQQPADDSVVTQAQQPADDSVVTQAQQPAGDSVVTQAQQPAGDSRVGKRLDSGDAVTYFGRGNAWSDLKEYDKALANYNEVIRLEPGNVQAYYNRGNAWLAKKEYDKALADYNEVIRLDPRYVQVYCYRAIAWWAKKEYGNALADYNEAIRLYPRHLYAYCNRGNVWLARKEYDKALADYNEAIGLDPGYAKSYYGRAVLDLINERSGAAEDARHTLQIGGPKGALSSYSILVGYLGARRQGHNQDAQAMLDEGARLDQSVWPVPIVRFYQGKRSEFELMTAATDNDKQTEAHCYLGYHCLLAGDKSVARAHFTWVRDHGNPGLYEYTMSLAELEKLNR